MHSWVVANPAQIREWVITPHLPPPKERDSFAKPEMGARVTKEEPGKVTNLKGQAMAAGKHSASHLCSQHEGNTSSAQDCHKF